MERKSSSKVPRRTAKENTFKKSGNKIFLVGILILTVVIYSNSFKNGFVKYDDDYYVTENKYIRDFSLHGFREIAFSYTKDELPVTLFSFALDYKLWKLDPLPYHVENLLFHLANILLVYLFVLMLFNNSGIAVFVALLFAVHPYRVESVAWIAERKDMLYSFFLLTSLLCYLKFIKEKHGVPWYLTALLFSILSVFSKFSGVTITFILILIDYYFKRTFTWKTIAEKLPFLIIPLLSLFIHFHYKPVTVNQMQESIFVYSNFDRLFLAFYSLLFYLIGLIFPVSLTVLHSYPFKTGGFLPFIYYLSPIILLLIIYLIIKLLKRFNDISRELVFSLLFFLVNISLFLHIIPFGGNVVVAERYTYISYLGLFIFAALFLAIWRTKHMVR